MTKVPIKSGQLLYVVGWGALSETGPLSRHSLQGVWVMSYENDFCNTLFGKSTPIFDSMLCAGKIVFKHYLDKYSLYDTLYLLQLKKMCESTLRKVYFYDTGRGKSKETVSKLICELHYNIINF